MDRYFDEGARTAHFLGCDVTKYHRTLTSDVGALLKAGFVLTDLVEPRPDPRLMDVPGMADELRRPMMLILSCRQAGVKENRRLPDRSGGSGASFTPWAWGGR